MVEISNGEKCVGGFLGAALWESVLKMGKQ